MTGNARYVHAISSIFLKDSSGIFSQITGSPVEDMSTQGTALIDVGNDGDLDLFICGFTKNAQRVFEFYENQGQGNFTLQSTHVFSKYAQAIMFVDDYNQDGFQDIMISGVDTMSNALLEIYFNDKNGKLILSNQVNLNMTSISNVLFFDADSDSLKDLFIVGRDTSGNQKANLFLGQANNVFAAAQNVGVDGFFSGDLDFGDIDNDGDHDIVRAGTGTSSGRLTDTFIYLNDGSGQFSKRSFSPIVDITSANLEILDIDNDGDVDIFLDGRDGSSKRHTKLYLNDGLGNFSLFDTFKFEVLITGDLHFFDIDGDGYVDIFHSGVNPQGERKSNFYLQINALEFIKIKSSPIPGYGQNMTSVADIDGDGFMDIFIAGLDQYAKQANRFYLNKTCQVALGVDSIVACDSLRWQDDSTYSIDNFSARYRMANAAQNGCDSIVELALQVNRSSKFSFTDSSCISYSYNKKVYRQTGVYQDTLTNVLGCDSVVTFNVQITPLSDSVLQKSDTLIAFDTTANSYHWVSCNNGFDTIANEKGREFVIPDNNSYAVIVHKGDCSDTSYCISLVSLDQFPSQKSLFAIGSNPTHDYVWINWSGPKSSEIVQLVDINGRILLNRRIESSLKLDLSELPKGIYFVKAGNSVQKIMKFYTYKGMLPCFFCGNLSTLFSNIEKALSNFSRL